jgi:hypothetical protein
MRCWSLGATGFIKVLSYSRCSSTWSCADIHYCLASAVSLRQLQQQSVKC